MAQQSVGGTEPNGTPVPPAAGTSLSPKLFCDLAHARSLREICHRLAAIEGKLRIWEFSSTATVHSGLRHEHRPCSCMKRLFHQLLDRLKGDIAEVALVERNPIQEGRFVFMTVAPK